LVLILLSLECKSCSCLTFCVPCDVRCETLNFLCASVCIRLSFWKFASHLIRSHFIRLKFWQSCLKRSLSWDKLTINISSIQSCNQCIFQRISNSLMRQWSSHVQTLQIESVSKWRMDQKQKIKSWDRSKE
jgi:hypothetical protein